MSGDLVSKTKALLVPHFAERHIDAALEHYSATVEKFIVGNWEGAEQSAGKFVEAVTKALVLKVGKAINNPRRFHAGMELRSLESIVGYPDTLRLVIPKAGIFVYEIVSNRGGRHDANEISANEMDAKAIMPVTSWILAELVRFCSETNPKIAMRLIAELTDKKYPYFEEIDGRFYVNHRGLKPSEIALLILYSIYPNRINRQSLIDSVARHGCTSSSANSAVHRLKSVVDESDSGWKLRGIGRKLAESLLKDVVEKEA